MQVTGGVPRTPENELPDTGGTTPVAESAELDGIPRTPEHVLPDTGGTPPVAESAETDERPRTLDRSVPRIDCSPTSPPEHRSNDGTVTDPESDYATNRADEDSDESADGFMNKENAIGGDDHEVSVTSTITPNIEASPTVRPILHPDGTTIIHKFHGRLLELARAPVTEENWTVFTEVVDALTMEAATAAKIKPRDEQRSSAGRKTDPGDAQGIQNLYRHNRRRAVRLILSGEGKTCSVDPREADDHFTRVWGPSTCDT